MDKDFMNMTALLLFECILSQSDMAPPPYDRHENIWLMFSGYMQSLQVFWVRIHNHTSTAIDYIANGSSPLELTTQRPL